MPFQATSTTILLFLSLFILAFFPSLFNSLLHLPLALLLPARLTTSTSQTHTTTPPTMSWFQKTLTLPPSARGSYLVTSHIQNNLPEIRNYKVGLLHLFVQHTSCALSLNENWDSDVREDMSDALDRLVPEDKGGRERLYRHDAEGSDDMPVSFSRDVHFVLVDVEEMKLMVSIETGPYQVGTYWS